MDYEQCKDGIFRALGLRGPIPMPYVEEMARLNLELQAI